MRSNVLVLFCLLIALQIFAKAHDHSVTSRCQLLDELLSGRLEKQHPVGVALGFGISPLIVPPLESFAKKNTTQQASDMFAEVRRGFQYLLYGGAVVITIDLLLILIFYKERPKKAPSRAQYARLLWLQQAGGMAQFDSNGDMAVERNGSGSFGGDLQHSAVRVIVTDDDDDDDDVDDDDDDDDAVAVKVENHFVAARASSKPLVNNEGEHNGLRDVGLRLTRGLTTKDVLKGIFLLTGPSGAESQDHTFVHIKIKKPASCPTVQAVDTDLKRVPVCIRSDGSPQLNIVSKQDGAASQIVDAVVNVNQEYQRPYDGSLGYTT
ncbi:Feline leukemia virus subgroup C receptor-related protein 2 [Sparganum proliferum]